MELELHLNEVTIRTGQERCEVEVQVEEGMTSVPEEWYSDP
jgi:hypothetical protein